MKVIKRNDSEQDFCLDKIESAIKKANMSVPENERMDDVAMQKVITTVQKKLDGFNSINVEDIQDFVEQSLIRHNKALIAKNYILYRNDKKNKKKFTPTEEKALSLLNGTSELRGDNANKHIDDNGSLRDYFAGLLCKSIANKTLPKKVIEAHNKGLIHYHDLDYSPVQPEHNCLHKDTKFITNKGVRKFSDFKDGDKVVVLTKDGNWKNAVVKYYGIGKLYKYKFYNYKKTVTKDVIATENHRWYLSDGSVTSDLKIGDKIVKAPIIYNQDTDYNTFDDIQKILWCKGFALGDGTVEYISKGIKSNRTRIRLCGEKDNKLRERFINESCLVRNERINGDQVVIVKNYTKEIPEFRNIDDVRAFINGLYCADGKLSNSNRPSRNYKLQSSKIEVINFIREYAPICGLYITSELELSGEKTNFTNGRPYTILFSFNPCVKLNYKVLSKEFYGEDETWCLEVEDEHNFVLSNGIVTGNCDVLDVENMFTYGFQMGSTKIEPNDETPFRTICNLLSQISLIVSGRQYGGQTITWAHTLPYIDNSRRLIRKEFTNRNWFTNMVYNKLGLFKKYCSSEVEKRLRSEIAEGVKIYQYQILCHSSSNGQTPFVSNNLCLREAVTQRELDDFAILIEEIFKRRIKGVKDGSGHYVTPLFPKLLYWMCEGLNVEPTDPYYYLTELAAECEIKRTQPDINSEKECRRIKEGQIIPSMGCRSLLGPIWEERVYPIDTKFIWQDVRNTVCVDYPQFDRIFRCGMFKFDNISSFADFENREYGFGYKDGEFAINFRGNTGWLMKKTDTEVTIYQPMVYGRFNQGVITINLPHVALEAVETVKKEGGDLRNTFFSYLDERLDLCREALLTRHESVKNIKAINSEILWMHGALARLKPEETVGDLMKRYPKRASISLGYVGLYETCRALIGESNTSENGVKMSKDILTYMNEKCNEWKKEDGLNYSIYGTPEESLTYKFAKANRKDFGLLEYITDKDYVVNSYHVDPREKIDAFTKLKIEGEYLALSSGGAVSYVETLDLKNNKKAILNIMHWMYEHILYAEFNRKIGVCYECGYEGDIELIKTEDGQFQFKCPHCGNTDDSKMDVTGRLCGYLGKISSGNTNKGRLDDIFNRFVHLDCFEDNVVGEIMKKIFGGDK